MKNFAFIFARGGSKGLPNKNTKELAGKPLVVHSIHSAQNVTSISEVFVSTEDAAIAEIATDAGAIVIARPETLADDSSPEWLSWQHAVTWARDNYGDFDGFVSLPPTSPLRSVSDIERAMEKIALGESDICISVVASSRNPFFNMVLYVDEAYIELVNKPDNPLHRRQDAPSVFDITTVVYATTPKFVLNNNGIFDGRVTCVEVPKDRAVDIDDIYDFMLAEAIVENRQSLRGRK